MLVQGFSKKDVGLMLVFIPVIAAKFEHTVSLRGSVGERSNSVVVIYSSYSEDKSTLI